MSKNNFYYLEIYYPELVEDIQRNFYLINKLGKDKHYSGELSVSVKTSVIDSSHEEYENLKYLFDKYPFLGKLILTFNFPSGTKSPVHQDDTSNERVVSLNIPIQGCTDQGITEFFDIDDKYMQLNDQGAGARYTTISPDALKNGLVIKKVGEYKLTNNPVLANIQIPHRINNTTSLAERLSISWTTNFKSWNDAVDYFYDRSVNPLISE